MGKARRTTHRSSKGKKLYAVRDASGRFKDIQTYERAHRADLAKTTKAEKTARTGRKTAKSAERSKPSRADAGPGRRRDGARHRAGQRAQQFKMLSVDCDKEVDFSTFNTFSWNSWIRSDSDVSIDLRRITCAPCSRSTRGALDSNRDNVNWSRTCGS
jgi:hypothetical protein